MKNRECVYCIYFFDCKGRDEKTDYCLRFIPKDEDANTRYKEWRNGRKWKTK